MSELAFTGEIFLTNPPVLYILSKQQCLEKTDTYLHNARR
jgi:hypothetical protein